MAEAGSRGPAPPCKLFLGLLAVLVAVPLSGAEPKPWRLEEGAPLVRTLARGELQRFTAELSPGSHWRIRLVPQGNPASLVVSDPSGKKALALATPRGLGFESAFVLAAGPEGTYLFEVAEEQSGAPVGRFLISVERQPTKSDRDRALAAAEDAATLAAAIEPTEDAARILARLEEAAAGLAPLRLRREELIARLRLLFFAAEKAPERAAAYLEPALALAEGLREDPLYALALEERAVVRHLRGDFAGAHEDFTRAASLWQKRGQRLGELRDRLNAATLLLRRGEPEAARKTLLTLAAPLRSLGERRLEAGLEINLGGAHANLGESEKAIAGFRRALAIAHEIGDERLEAQTRHDLASLLRRLGETGEALSELRQALETFRRLGDRVWQARALNNLGYAYLGFGLPSRAESALQEALELRRAAGDRAGISVTLKNLLRTALAQGELGRAENLSAEVLALDTALGNRRGEAMAYSLEGELRQRKGETAAALAAFRRALELSHTLGNRSAAARARLGLVESDPEAPDASRQLEVVLAEAKTLGERDLVVEALAARARLERRSGELAAAEATLMEAIDGIESLRTAIADLDQRSAFLSSQSAAYRELIAVLLEQDAGRMDGEGARKAFEVSERARARTLLDWLEGAAAGSDAHLPRELRERFLAARRKLNAKAQRQLELLAAGQPAAAARAEADAALGELEALRAAMGRRSPAFAGLIQKPLRPAARAFELLPEGTTLLEYSLGAEDSVLWEVRKGAIRAHRLPPGPEIEALARRAAADLAGLDLRLGRTRGENLSALGKVLLGSLPHEVFAPGSRLAIVPDGFLFLVPFAALPSPAGDGPVLDTCEVVQLSSAAALDAQRRAARRKPRAELAIFADPVFSPDDPRLPAGTAIPAGEGFLAGYSRLPETRREAEEILALAGKGPHLAAFGFDASRELFESGAADDHRVLHFATHGVAFAERPDLSGILLSQLDGAGRRRGGLLTVQDLLGRRLAADLVVLSGCSTAFGEAIHGEGLVGLARGFLYAGAPRVMASLWPVEEKATRLLMGHFYRAYFGGVPAAAALRAAQLELRRDPALADPYFWGPFVLIGDWR